MRARALLIAGVVAIAVGVVGLLVAAPATASQASPAAWGLWPGGMMGMHGPGGMMGGPVAANATPIGLARASAAARDYVARFGPTLELGEVMEFAANYYAEAIEVDTGIHAFEVLVDKYSGVVFPEMGPNMVWNVKYGHMAGGVMGRWQIGGAQGADMPITPQRAQELAAQYLQAQGLPLAVAEPERFYGYYTLHTLRNGEIEGMLSVNGFTGDVWYHVWHGPFVRMQEGAAGGS